MFSSINPDHLKYFANKIKIVTLQLMIYVFF